jgi:hypothetical protein
MGGATAMRNAGYGDGLSESKILRRAVGVKEGAA